VSIETPEYAAMLRRMIRAYGRRVGEADDVDLAEMVAMREVLEEAIADAVAGQRANYDRSWAEVARGLGVSRQYAQRRYGSGAEHTFPDQQRYAG
jgi:hypothetical protein